MLQVIGDTICLDGEPVGTILTSIPATIRERVVDAIHEVSEPHEELERIEAEYDKLDAELAERVRQRDAYAAILGVTP